jgi:hypothetical protein
MLALGTKHLLRDFDCGALAKCAKCFVPENDTSVRETGEQFVDVRLSTRPRGYNELEPRFPTSATDHANEFVKVCVMMCVIHNDDSIFARNLARRTVMPDSVLAYPKNLPSGLAPRPIPQQFRFPNSASSGKNGYPLIWVIQEAVKLGKPSLPATQSLVEIE